MRHIGMHTVVCAASILLLAAPGTRAQEQERASQQATALAATSDGFVNAMALAGLAEVQLGKLAMEKAGSPDVKAFAQLMVKEHSQAGEELAAIATQLAIRPPTEIDKKNRDLIERLNAIQPRDFDRVYVAAMIDGHREVERLLQARGGGPTPAPTTAGEQAPLGTSGKDPADPLTRWARRMAPMVHQHLEQAQQLQQNIK